MNESHISSQRLNLDPCPIHSMEGPVSWFKETWKFNDIWIKEIEKPILQHKSDQIIKRCCNTDRLAFKKLNENNKIDLSKFINWLKPIYKRLISSSTSINIENFNRLAYPNSPFNNDPKQQNITTSKLEKEIAKVLIDSNISAMPEIKRKSFNYLQNLRKYKQIKITGSNEEILNHFIDCNSQTGYLRQLSEGDLQNDNSVEYSVSISNWYGFQDDNSYINDWESVYPLINIIYNTWYQIASKNVKKINGVTNVSNYNGAKMYITVKGK